MVKNLPAMQETWVWSLSREDLLEKGMSIHSSIFAWRILWTEEPGGLLSLGLQRVGHDWATNTTLLLSRVWFFATLWITAHQAPLSFTVSQSLLKIMSMESEILTNHLILCCPLLLLPSIFPSIRVFSNELALHIRWPNYWSFNISPFSEYSGLISFRIDWFDLLDMQGTLVFSNTTVQKHHSLALSFLYGPALSSIYDYWKNHSCDYMDLCWQSDVSTFYYTV